MKKYASTRDAWLKAIAARSKRYTISSSRESPTSSKFLLETCLPITPHNHLLLLQSTQRYLLWPMSVLEP
jgi:hypothetical protein